MDYRAAFRNFFEQSNFIADLNDPAWAKLESEIVIPSQEELIQIAKFDYSPLVAGVKDLAVQITPRVFPKNPERIKEKMTTDRAKVGPSFKSISDWAGVWIECEAYNMLAIWSHLCEEWGARGSRFLLAQPPQPNDICARMYVYDPIISPVIIEIWIGHPYVKHTFTINSLRRKYPEIPKPFGLVYDMTKACIIRDWALHTTSQ